MILEAIDSQEKKNSEAAMGDFKTWASGLMSIMQIEDENKIPDITPYDAYTNGMDPSEYAVFISEPADTEDDVEEMMSSPVSGDSDEDWIYDLEGEMDAKMDAMKSGDVVDLSSYADNDEY